jgi:transcriptional regulator with XRE-family HTH domain
MKRLREIRKAKGLTQIEVCRKARLGQGYLAQLELGIKRNPSLDVLKRLAKALGVTVTDLLA